MEQIEKKGNLNEKILIETTRPNGTVRIQEDYEFCPTITEQHTAHLSDLNYLVKKYKPDELAAYIAARTAHRTEILGHDFSKEPSLQEAKNQVLQIKKVFEQLPEEVQKNFANAFEFVKFVDNPQNASLLAKKGFLSKEQIEIIKAPQTTKSTKETKEEVKP